MELTTFVLFPSVATKLLQRLSFSQSACWCKIQYKGRIGCPIALGSVTTKSAVYPTTLKEPSVVNELGVNGKNDSIMEMNLREWKSVDGIHTAQTLIITYFCTHGNKT